MTNGATTAPLMMLTSIHGPARWRTTALGTSSSLCDSISGVVMRVAMNDRKIDMKIFPHVEATVAEKKANKAQHGTPMTGRTEISGKGEVVG